MLVISQNWFDLAHPIKTQAFLFFVRERGSCGANEPQDGSTEVVLALDAIDPYPIGEGASEEVSPTCPFDNIADHSGGSSHHEVIVAQEGQISNRPLPCLSFLELVPLIGREEEINIRHVKVLA